MFLEQVASPRYARGGATSAGVRLVEMAQSLLKEIRFRPDPRPRLIQKMGAGGMLMTEQGGGSGVTA